MTSGNESPYPDAEAQDGFIRILLADVMSAQERLRADPSQSNKRDLIRCAFAAIEGTVWLYCTHIASVAKSMDEIGPAEEMALSQLSYHVTAQGQVKDQMSYLQAPTAIRLATQIAQRLEPGLEVDFSTPEWTEFREATNIRNRITHPKSRFDLLISDDDAATCIAALHWLLELATYAMKSVNTAFAGQTAELWDVFTRLEQGDPETWRLYRSLLGPDQD